MPTSGFQLTILVYIVRGSTNIELLSYHSYTMTKAEGTQSNLNNQSHQQITASVQ